MNYISRKIEDFLAENLSIFPAVVILGSRQCGKSTLIKKMAENREDIDVEINNTFGEAELCGSLEDGAADYALCGSLCTTACTCAANHG